MLKNRFYRTLIIIIGIIFTLNITACDLFINDTENDNGEKTPVIGDFYISGIGTFAYDGIVKTVTVTAKEGKTSGAVTVKFNGNITAPSDVGVYTVTFDVTAVIGWNAVNGLFAGTLTIGTGVSSDDESDILNDNEFIADITGNRLSTATWYQFEPFNNQLNIVNGERIPTSCNITAAAIIMKYHEHPQMFDWNKMLNNYHKVTYSDVQANAVAALMYEVKNAFNSTGHSRRAIQSFNYTARTIIREEIGDNWNNILKEQIDSGLPVYYSAKRTNGGHAFVLEGYNTNGLFYVNWGWNGNRNGWYSSNALHPTGTDRKYDYNHSANINIMPVNDLSNTLSNALSVIEDTFFTTTQGAATNAVQAKNIVNETITSLNLGDNITFKVHDVGTSPFPFTESTLGSNTTTVEYKFVVSLTKDSVTFTSGIQALTIINFADGNGTELSPYEIANVTQFGVLATVLNNSSTQVRNFFLDKHYKLTADINLSENINWIPMGSSSNRAFNGVFDGNRKKISNLIINHTTNGAGLFGYNNGIIKNIGLENVDIKSTATRIGGIAGYNYGTIINSYVKGGIIIETIGAVGTASHLGGIAGYNNGIINNCYSAEVEITGVGTRIGGITGSQEDSGSINNSWSTTMITGGGFIGGIAGYIEGGSIKNCAALNNALNRTDGSTNTTFGRVVGRTGGDFTLTNNVAFGGMTVRDNIITTGTTENQNGLSRNISELHTANGFPITLTQIPWYYVIGKLPCFTMEGVNMPVYLTQ